MGQLRHFSPWMVQLSSVQGYCLFSVEGVSNAYNPAEGVVKLCVMRRVVINTFKRWMVHLSTPPDARDSLWRVSLMQIFPWRVQLRCAFLRQQEKLA